MSVKSMKYLKIAEDLRGKIKADNFSLGRLPSERELALQYKVNRITLRKALDLLGKRKIISRHGRMGTLVNAENNGTSGRTLVYILVNRNQLDPFHSRTLFWLEKQARTKGYKMLFSSVSSAVDVDEFIRVYGEDNDIGAIVLSGLVTAAVAKKLQKLTVPVVLVGGLTYKDPVEKQFHRIYLDSLGYSCHAVQKLIANGHRKIAFINGPSYKYYLDIYQGYLKAFELTGCKYDEKLIISGVPDSFDEVYKVAVELLITHRPTAFFIANERMAEATLRAIKDQKRKSILAEDIITVGGNQSLAENLGYSMVYIDNRLIAEKTMEIIEEAKGIDLRKKITKKLKYKIIMPRHK